jgi:hypothetical protein
VKPTIGGKDGNTIAKIGVVKRNCSDLPFMVR